MTIEQRLIQPFQKAKYLSETNFRRYTTIIHYLYIQHEVYYAPPALPSAILEHMLTNDHLATFEDYDLPKLEADLKQLEEWGNVITHPDTGNVTKLEDFNKRKLRYQCSQDTVEIERLMERLSSQISHVQRQLDARNVANLAGMILQLEKYDQLADWRPKEREELYRLWHDLFVKFDDLRKNSSDYLGVINSRNLEEAMQNKNMSTFQFQFKEYLTSFIIAIQKNMYLIADSIEKTGESLVFTLVRELVLYQQEQPTLDDDLNGETYESIFLNQWEGMKKWFVRDSFGERYVDYLLKQTSDTISRFTKYLQQLSEREQMTRNRRKDLEHLAKLFRKETDFALCQACFGAMTNIERPLHLFSPKERKVFSDKPLLEHLPEMMLLKDAKEAPVREKRLLVATEVSAEELQVLKDLERLKAQQEKEVLDLIAKRFVRIKDLQAVTPFVRQTMLNWISACYSKGEMSGKTEHGIGYRLLTVSEELVEMTCLDGRLIMPDYELEFEVAIG